MVVVTDHPEWSTLPINDGDVILWRTDQDFADDENPTVDHLLNWLITTGRARCIVVTVPTGEDLSTVDEDAMREAGWIRAEGSP